MLQPGTVGVQPLPSCPNSPWADYLRYIAPLHLYETYALARQIKRPACNAFVERLRVAINAYDLRNPVDQRLANQRLANQRWNAQLSENRQIVRQLVEQQLLVRIQQNRILAPLRTIYLSFRDKFEIRF